MGTHIRKQRETFQALGKAEILNDSDFCWIGSCLHNQIPPGPCGTGCLWSKGSRGLSILSTLLTQPAASAAFVPWSFTKSALTHSRFCPWCSCLCPLPTHTDRTHIREGQSSSPSTDLSEGRWITHFTHIRHIQQGSDMSTATCQEALVRNVLMWEQSGDKALRKEEIRVSWKEHRTNNHEGKGETGMLFTIIWWIHHNLKREFCLKEKIEWRETQREQRETPRDKSSPVCEDYRRKINQPPAYSRHLPWGQDHGQTTMTVCLWQQFLKGIPEDKEESKLQVLQSRG